MSAPNSTPSSSTSTPSRPRNSPRPSPSPVERTFSPSPSTSSTLSAAAAGVPTPRRSSTPLTPGPLSPKRKSLPIAAGGLATLPSSTSTVTGKTREGEAGWNDLPAESLHGVGVERKNTMGKGRARDLLRKHYGLGVGPPQPLSGPGKPLDPMDIDSPAFDARSYYEQLISTSSLMALLKHKNQLHSEIRQLDNDRQSLVYNHHHELIAASDTISAMKTRAENIDVDLDKLRVAFSEISRLNDELTGSLS